MRSPAQVREFATPLAALDPDELTRRFDPDRMTVLEISPDRIRHRTDEDAAVLDYLPGTLADPRAFTAAAAGDALVVRVA